MVAGSVFTKILALEGMRPEERSARRRHSRSSSTSRLWSVAAPKRASAPSRPEPRGPRDRASKPITVPSFIRRIGW